MKSEYKKKDPRIDIVKYVSKNTKVSRIDIINDMMDESIQDINKVLNELVKDSSLAMDASDQSSDFDKFTIPSDIQKKSFNELF